MPDDVLLPFAYEPYKWRWVHGLYVYCQLRQWANYANVHLTPYQHPVETSFMVHSSSRLPTEKDIYKGIKYVTEYN